MNRCATKGCPHVVRSDLVGLCRKCEAIAWSRKSGQHKADTELSDAVVADVRRRNSAFQSITKICAETGLNRDQVRLVLGR